MFDSLKEKLGSFRKDAEEAAEENAEELDPEDAEVAEGEAVDAADVDGEEASAAVDATADATASTDEATAAASDADAPDADVADADPSASDVDADAADDDGVGDDAAADDDDAAADGDESSKSTGFARKAKSLATGKFVIEEEDLEGPLQELEIALLSSDVEMGVAQQILDNIREDLVGETRKFTESTGSVVESALRDALYDVISVGQFDFEQRVADAEKPMVIIFTGVNGVGKTTSIAKMARYFEERGMSSVMANGDTYRAGANEQIREHADALGKKLIAHEQGGDPAAVIYDAVEYANANDVDVVLGDTAGRLHTNEGLMDQLEKIGRVVGPDMTLFVDEAVAGQDAVQRAKQFDDAAEIDGAILTKADADSNGGAAISVAHVTGKPILFLGVGQGYDHLERFDPDRMVDRLLDDE
ncbi:signal recognition particle-docking protein FtsY [Halorubellus sp. PRR65]|uniref:signal recognition particle-docking protein FtsY n=1 Tax=Halorubellus sp. PRR65 TaxID=3098148 RepID=UPI002B25A07C|nr:signal recognition particle-docking protein FtsY [Halorubellus sp. PRR65]